MKASSNTRRPVNRAAIEARARRLRAATIGDLMSQALTWVARGVASAVARLKAGQTLRARSAH
ncbi:MAG: hypothetical protein ABWZ41_02825 [Burkholderiales bacterium]|jgi:hypothetical protein